MNESKKNHSDEKCYLKWYNKIGYGSGDMAANMVYALLTNFVLIYLTDTVGLNPGIVGTLMMFSKFADGITDIFFGLLVDRTKSKMGKARPWMFYAYFGNALLCIAVFAIPSSWGETAQYAYFFLTYTLLNAVFYTANNIAYAALTSLITKNVNERVEIGSIRFMFSLATSLIISYATVDAVEMLGGGAEGWRNIAILYSVIGLLVNTVSVFSVKELPDEELGEEQRRKRDKQEKQEKQEKLTLGGTVRILLANRYYVIICLIYIANFMQNGISAVGIFYMTYVLKDPGLLGVFSASSLLPMIVGLVFTPQLVKHFGGMYRVNLYGYTIAFAARIFFVIGGITGNVPVMLLSGVIAGAAASPVAGDLNALISAAAEYTYHTTGKRVEGSMFSCSSLGIKVGSGIGVAVSGWLLAASGYVANAAQQAPSCIMMLQFLYCWIPLIMTGIIAILLYLLKVEQANEKNNQ